MVVIWKYPSPPAPLPLLRGERGARKNYDGVAPALRSHSPSPLVGEGAGG